MLNCFSTDNKNAVPIQLVSQNNYQDWLATQSPQTKAWLTGIQFRTEPGNAFLVPNANGDVAFVVCCRAYKNHYWDVGNLPLLLPEGVYAFAEDDPNYEAYAETWGLGAYQFTRYKSPKKNFATLYLPKKINSKNLQTTIESIHMVRDLINTPTDHMGPTEFAAVAQEVAKKFAASFTQIVGDELLQENFASIYTVGRASDDAPRLIDITWGEDSHPRVTLVGKGVCFDSGGLDIKPSSAMLLMKKDMGGAAHVLGLAQMIMAAKLPIRLRVLMPVVENVISGNAYRPGDIIKSRKGLTIEVGNTDAEGRVILADALTEAVSEKPKLLIDIATLTGAARIALGTELPAVFSNNDAVVNELIQIGDEKNDPMWRLPLFQPYRDYVTSQIADINNNSNDPYGGAITAALFLQTFVADDVPWLHFDMMAWNLRARPGRPQGAEAMTLRALFHFLKGKFES